jgi:AraC-like DNA-binding protein
MPSTYFELALRVFADCPEAAAALCEGTGVPAGDVPHEITLGQQLQLVRNLNRLQPPGWGLQLGSRFEAATHGPLGFAAVSAPTVGAAIDVIRRFARVRAPYYRLTTSRTDGHFVLAVDEAETLSEAERIPLLECLALSLQHVLEPILGMPMRSAAFRFVWAPPSYAARYPQYFHGTVSFNTSRTSVEVPQDWLRVRSPVADAAMYQTSLRKLEALERRLERDEHLTADVENLIAARRGVPPSLVQVAAHLHLSPRTLIRRLRRAGTTYNGLLDAHRRALATSMLASPDYHITEVSHALGYGDVANFGRACRRWFGMAPSHYRGRLFDAGTERPPPAKSTAR